MSYIERERQHAEALQQEQLDWLHQQHELLAQQTELLRYQWIALQRIQLYAGWILGLILAGVIAGGLLYLLELLAAATR